MSRGGSVSLRNIVKRHGSLTVLKGVDLDIRPGEFFALLGPSGSGKTTTLRILAGLESHDAGNVILDGRDVTGSEPGERDVAMVFQSYALYPHMSVYENIAFPLRMVKTPNSEIDRAVRESASRVKIAHLLERRPGQLSGGQQQRCALARAIVRKPRLFLLDEPLSNLDARLRVSMRGEIRALQKSLGITAIYVTHDQEEAMSVSDRIALMNAGKLEQIGVPVEIYRQPASRFAAEFMGTTNFLQARQLGLAAPVWVSLRPEALRFADEAPADWPRLAATVARVEMLGPISRFDVTLANGTVLKMATLDAPHRAVAVGDAVTVAYEHARLTVVP